MKKLIELKEKEVVLRVVRLVASVFLLFVGCSTKSSGISTAFLIIAYMIVATESLYRAAVCVVQKKYFNDTVIMFLINAFTLVLGIKYAAIAVNICYYIGVLEKMFIDYFQSAYSLYPDNNVDHVNVVDEFGAVSVSMPDQIKKGDKVIVNPGEIFLTDGIVIDGFSKVNPEAVTHERINKEIGINDRVMAGYINLSSQIIYESANSVDSTHVDYMKKHSEKAFASRRKGYPVFNRYNRIISSVLLFGALIAMLISFFTDIRFDNVVVLLILSATVSVKNIIDFSVVKSIYSGASNGIVYNSADTVTGLSGVSAAVFEFKDKIGYFTVSGIEVFDEYSEDNLKDIASALYSKSALPYASTVCLYSGYEDSSARISGYKEFDNSGCFAYIDGHQIVSGSTSFMEKSKVYIPFNVDDDFCGVHFAVDGNYIGNIRFECNDFYKLSGVIADMKKCGVKHFIVFGCEDEIGADHIRNILKADYFSVDDDRTKILNDIMDNVKGRIALFGWHDWLVSGVYSVYLGKEKIDDAYVDASVAVAGNSVERCADVIELSHMAKDYAGISFCAFSIFKLIVVVLMFFGIVSVIGTLLCEALLYAGLSAIIIFKHNKLY